MTLNRKVVLGGGDGLIRPRCGNCRQPFDGDGVSITRKDGTPMQCCGASCATTVWRSEEEAPKDKDPAVPDDGGRPWPS